MSDSGKPVPAEEQRTTPGVVGKDEALARVRAHVWGWRYGDYDDYSGSPEESHAFVEWVEREFERRHPIGLSEPEETPCGWLMHPVLPGWPTFKGPVLVNFWTGEVVYGYGWFSNGDGELRSFDACLRWYIRHLPADQREAALARRDKLPFAPVRFDPPYLQTTPLDDKSRNTDGLRSHYFTVEFDLAYFSALGMEPPGLVVEEHYWDSKTSERLPMPRDEALTKLDEQDSGNKRVAGYLLTIPEPRKQWEFYEWRVIELNLPGPFTAGSPLEELCYECALVVEGP